MDDIYDFKFHTLQTSAFKLWIQGLSKYMNNCSLHINSKSITINELLDDSIILHNKLYAENFEYYECNNHKSLFINLKELVLILKQASCSDELTIYKYSTKQYWCIHLYNSDKTNDTYQIVYEVSNKIPPVIEPQLFDMSLNWSSNEYKNIIHKIKTTKSESIYITIKENDICIGAKGSRINYETSILDDNYGLKESFSPITYEIPYKYLSLLTHFTNLCNNMCIYLDSISGKKMCAFKYDIASLGCVKLGVNLTIKNNQ